MVSKTLQEHLQQMENTKGNVTLDTAAYEMLDRSKNAPAVVSVKAIFSTPLAAKQFIAFMYACEEASCEFGDVPSKLLGGLTFYDNLNGVHAEYEKFDALFESQAAEAAKSVPFRNTLISETVDSIEKAWAPCV